MSPMYFGFMFSATMVLLSALAPLEASDPNMARVPGSRAWGGTGTLTLDSAEPLVRHALIVTAAGAYFQANNLLLSGDTVQQGEGALHIAWAAGLDFELGLSASLAANSYSATFYRTSQYLGNPVVHGKFTQRVAPQWRVGGALHVRIPSGATQGGLALNAPVVDARFLATLEALANLDINFNIGAVFDDSRNLLARPVLPELRLLTDVYDYHRLTYGVGALARFDVLPSLGLAPFAEARGMVGAGIPFVQNHLAAAVGVKIYPSDHVVEGSIAADFRVIEGNMAAQVHAPVQPAWTLLAHVGLHLFEQPPAPPIQRCQVDADCMGEQLCRDGLCTRVEIRQVIRNQDLYTLGGTVTDAVSHKPMGGAVILLGGFEQTPILTQEKTGQFVTWPLPVRDGLLSVQVSAPGYTSQEQLVRRDQAPGTRTKLDFALVPDTRPTLGTFRGSIYDGKSGAPLTSCTVFLPAIRVNLTPDERGKFALEARTGHYDVIISCKGYATQRKKLTLHEGEVIIIDADMRSDDD